MGAMGLVMDKTPGRLSLLQLRDMLLFADAVGCSKTILESLAGLLRVCVRQQLEVQLPSTGTGSSSRAGGSKAKASKAASGANSEVLILELDSVYTNLGVQGESVLRRWQAGRSELLKELDSEQQQQLRQAVAEQLESLLYTAFKLDARPLVRCLLRFVQNNTVAEDSILTACVEQHTEEPPATENVIFSPRVLSVAGGSCGGELLTRACLQLRLGRGFGIGTIFDMDEDTIRSRGLTTSFTAELLKDFYDYSKGSTVRVSINMQEGNIEVTTQPEDDDDEEEEEQEEVDPSVFDFGVVVGHERAFLGAIV